MNIELLDVLRDELGEDVQFDFGRLKSQEAFLTDPHTYKVLSGGFSTGKSTVLIAHCLALLAIPGNLGYLGRQDGKALRASTMQTFYEMVPKNMYTRNDQQGRITFKKEYGGSTLIYGDFKDLNDLKNIPLGFFAIDQMEEVSLDVFLYLVGRNRRRVPVLDPDTGLKQYEVIGRCEKPLFPSQRHYALHGDVNCRSCGRGLTGHDVVLKKRKDGSRSRDWELIIYARFGLGACNPEGPSHWIFKLFPGLPGDKGLVSKGLTGDNAEIPDKAKKKLAGRLQGFHSSTYEAEEAGFCDSDYVNDMEALYSTRRQMKLRYLDGLWVEAEGLVYPGFNRQEHLVRLGERYWNDRTRPIVPGSAPVYEYIDPALTAHTAVGWVIFEDCDCGCQKQNIYIRASYYQDNPDGRFGISHHCNAIKNIRRQISNPLQLTFIDSQALSRTMIRQTSTEAEDELFSVADAYADNGIFASPNQKNWDLGYNLITEALLPDPHHVDPRTGEMGGPHLLIVEETNPSVVFEFETYKWKKVRNEHKFQEEPEDKNDHHMDGLNGLLASKPASSAPSIVDDGLTDYVDDWGLEQQILEFEFGKLSHMSA